VSIRLLNCQTRNPSRSCISRSTSQSHSLSDSISQRASLFTYHLVRAGYSPVPSSRITLIAQKTLASSLTSCASSGFGSERRTDTSAKLATDPTQLTSSRTCHRHVTLGLDLPHRLFPCDIHHCLRCTLFVIRADLLYSLLTSGLPHHVHVAHYGRPTVTEKRRS
jgi:hypothetical protein